MYNRVILMGRLTRDPESKTTPSGVSTCRFSIAVDRQYQKQGEERQADFFDVTVWRNTAEFVCKYFSKGKMIHIEGRLQNNNYTDNDGVKHYQNSIIADNVSFCGDKGGSSQNTAQTTNYAQVGTPTQQTRPAQQTAAQAPQPVELGDLGDFEEILNDGEVPF